MKKTAILFMAVMAVALFTRTTLAASGTESNWDLNLSFTAGSASDLLEVTIGTNSSAEELLKPPHLPGQEDTGNAANAYVRAYVVTSAARQAAKSIDTSNKLVWAIEIDAEKAGETVSVDLGDANYYDKYYPITIVVPGEAVPVKEIRSTDNKKVDLFVSNGAPRRIYAVAGESRTFAATTGSDSKVFGLVELPGVGLTSGTAVKLFTAPCGASASKEATTDANGMYEIDSVSAGSYVVQLSKDYYLGSECNISMGADGVETTACGTLYTGDFNKDGNINLFDITAIKDYYGKTKNAPPTGKTWDDIKYIDTNADDAINLFDVSEIKAGYGKQDKSICGS